MDYGYQDRQDLEDDLYQDDEGESEGSEVGSELEFRLYSQLHYSSNPGELEEQGGEEEPCPGNQQEVIQRNADLNGEQELCGDDHPPSPSNGTPQLHLKKNNKGEKQKKLNKKKKIDPKGQKSSSSSSRFEEVIVINSSPDIISICEDSTEEDEGICSLKGHGSHQQRQTSTPALQDSRKKKSIPRAPVIVDSSSSESESEESESDSESESESDPDSLHSSDSEALENWMLLGRGNQDGDKSISLNLEGGSDSGTDADEEEGWLVSDKDKEARIYNRDKGPRFAVQRVSNRYYTDKNVHCRNCNKTGHLSKSCPDPKKLVPCVLCGTPGHLSSECPNKHCNNCGLPGHLYKSCTERSYWHKQCHRCKKTGHFFDACPEIWRQYHMTTKASPPVQPQDTKDGQSSGFCYNCAKRGHLGHACSQKRMFSGVYPNAPFINHYDTEKEIQSRQHRIRSKVKELKRNGLLIAVPNSPLTPGPPRKKQRISHYKNNHQPNNTPHRTPNSHKPSPSHIFFHDDEEFSATKSKTSKHKQQENISKSAKPWKPKRPVPTARNPPPSKLILDEAEDFPRGGGTEESMRKKKKIKFKNQKHVHSAFTPGYTESRPDPPAWTARGKKQKPPKKEDKKKNNWRHQAGRGRRKCDSNMYPTDENLFIIKQRKRSR